MSSKICLESLQHYCRKANTPIALGVYLRAKYCPADLIDLSIDPLGYTEAQHQKFRKDYQAVNYLRKLVGFNSPEVLRNAAISAVKSAELAAYKMNRTMDTASWRNASAPLLYKVQRKIADILGPYSPKELHDFGCWSNGATSTIPRTRSHPGNKVGEQPISIAKSAYLTFVEHTNQHYILLEQVLGSRPSGPVTLLPTPENFGFTDVAVFDHVPKDSKTDRPISKEPTWSMYFQKALGQMIRYRLRRNGCNLNDQRVNQSLAKRAYTDRLATIDLSAASDSICYNLVRELLPLPWLNALCEFRSNYFEIDKQVYLMERFSSMGNGYTFELESLIFLAIALVSCEAAEVGTCDASVYGDDIIVPQAAADHLIRNLTTLGFSVNKRKSYVEGLFYESCGHHYFAGYYVTPVYQKERIQDEPSRIRAANRLFRASCEFSYDDYLGAWNFLFHAREDKWCYAPPHTEGDAAYLCPLELARVDYKLSRGFVSHGYFETPLRKRVGKKGSAILTRAVNQHGGLQHALSLPDCSWSVLDPKVILLNSGIPVTAVKRRRVFYESWR